MAGHDAAGSNFNPAESTLTPGALSRLTYERGFVTAPYNPAFDCPPPPSDAVAVDGVIYYLSADYVEAHQISTGVALWRSQLWPRPGEHPATGLAVKGGRVLVSLSDCLSNSDPTGFLVAFDARTGTRLWQNADVPADTFTMSASTVAYRHSTGVCCTPGVVVIDAASGREEWRADETVTCGPLIVVAEVIPDCDLGANGRLIAKGMALSSGRIVWTRTVDSRFAFTRGDGDTHAGKDLYARDYSGRIIALNPTTGRTKWRAANETGDVLGVGAARLFVTCGNAEAPAICALSRADGRRLWETPGVTAPTAVAIAAGVVYPSPKWPPVVAETGDLLWESAYAASAYAASADNVIVARGKLIMTAGRIIDVFGLQPPSRGTVPLGHQAT
ncbi:hypothetical protein GCM10023258_36640 [Terrabacter aeriphilus]|uniref:Pyrrolo-quinoline quinone repeat domain-containing protein n=2 Tax=Terrabacter aeriphilus TaxID=515662 RepID=A0ABP9JL88_9MICO